MKFLIVLCAALACAAAQPWSLHSGYAFSPAFGLSHAIAPWPSARLSGPVYSAPLAFAVPAITKRQYHAQDELGQASYGHSEPAQNHHAFQDAFGNKVGSYSYTAPDGRIMRTDYVADALGYRASSSAVAPHGIHHRIAKRSIALAPLAFAPAGLASHTFVHHGLAAPIAYSTAPWTTSYYRSTPRKNIVYSTPVALSFSAPAITKRQYHAQDELGQASYGHSELTQNHHATQDAFGNKVGSYSYTAPDGRIMRTDYVADALGYRASSSAVAPHFVA